MMRRSLLAGVVLMAAGMAGYLWIATRTLVPVDGPVTFMHGHTLGPLQGRGGGGQVGA